MAYHHNKVSNELDTLWLILFAKSDNTQVLHTVPDIYYVINDALNRKFAEKMFDKFNKCRVNINYCLSQLKYHL